MSYFPVFEAERDVAAIGDEEVLEAVLNRPVLMLQPEVLHRIFKMKGLIMRRARRAEKDEDGLALLVMLMLYLGYQSPTLNGSKRKHSDEPFRKEKLKTFNSKLSRGIIRDVEKYIESQMDCKETSSRQWIMLHLVFITFKKVNIVSRELKEADEDFEDELFNMMHKWDDSACVLSHIYYFRYAYGTECDVYFLQAHRYAFISVGQNPLVMEPHYRRMQIHMLTKVGDESHLEIICSLLMSNVMSMETVQQVVNKELLFREFEDHDSPTLSYIKKELEKTETALQPLELVSRIKQEGTIKLIDIAKCVNTIVDIEEKYLVLCSVSKYYQYEFLIHELIITIKLILQRELIPTRIATRLSNDMQHIVTLFSKSKNANMHLFIKGIIGDLDNRMRTNKHPQKNLFYLMLIGYKTILSSSVNR